MKRVARILTFALVLGACSASFWQNAAQVAQAVASCVAPIVLDVTGLATEDPIQIAASCGVAVSDVYNWVSQAIASAQVVSADAAPANDNDGGALAIKFQVKPGGTYYCTPAQFARLQRIQARAQKLLDGGDQ